MTPDLALQLARDMLWTALLVGAPVIGASMLVGLLISIFQVVTQVQEMTLTFVPKLLVIFFVLLTAGSWMLSTLLSYSARLISSIPSLIG
ncbi:flagellar biosynthesis protein FliQ [Nevskia soli]|uniref:flagellar biosynthesis protein FliQ n=1 Tax=Nevskia soli TaxID=418856 RepID=UPI0004A73FE5|nr:flagellar biosynthesis protein FliQ [Nevskia soli]